MQNGKTEAVVKKDSNEISQNLTNDDTNFTPTPVMNKWLETAFNLGYSASITDIEKESGVSRGSWYVWIAKDEFVKWWDEQWQKHLKGSRWKLDAIGLDKSVKDYRYWKDMMNRTGNTIPEPMSIGQQINTQFNIPNANLERIVK